MNWYVGLVQETIKKKLFLLDYLSFFPFSLSRRLQSLTNYQYKVICVFHHNRVTWGEASINSYFIVFGCFFGMETVERAIKTQLFLIFIISFTVSYMWKEPIR